MTDISDLENQDDYKIIKRIEWTKDNAIFPIKLRETFLEQKLAIVVDLETSGLDHKSDEIIELGMVRVKYDQEGITGIVDKLSLYEQPKKPIPDFITELTGITNEKVEGQKIDENLVTSMLALEDDRVSTDMPILIAHNAAFDRKFFDKRFPNLSELKWACSQSQIDWRKRGFESAKLEYLLLKNGFFYEGHRASIDCLATAKLLTLNGAFNEMIENAEKLGMMISANGAPFDVKDELKARGYQFDANKKVWRKELEIGFLEKEQIYLSKLYPGGAVRSSVKKINARNRFK